MLFYCVLRQKMIVLAIIVKYLSLSNIVIIAFHPKYGDSK